MKGLDWTNETWVRVYRSDTPAWKRLKWEAQTVYLALLRKLDRAGCLSFDGLMDFEAVAEMTGCPEDVAERALERLYQLGFLARSGDGDMLVDPEYIERDEAASSDAQRKRDSRARRRDRATSQNVTRASDSVTEPSRAVTRGHGESHAVTPIPSEPSLSEPAEPRKADSPEPAADGDSTPLPEPVIFLPFVGREPRGRQTRHVDGKPPEWREMAIYPDEIKPMRDACPGVNVDAELLKARSWSLANRAKQKSAGGMLRFLNGWMERAQNGAGRNGPRGTPPPRAHSSQPHTLSRGNLDDALDF